MAHIKFNAYQDKTIAGCCQDIKAMDIYAAQFPDHLQDEQSSGLALALALVTVIQTPLEHWIKFGLLIEKSHSVVFLH